MSVKDLQVIQIMVVGSAEGVDFLRFPWRRFSSIQEASSFLRVSVGNPGI